MKKEHVDMLLSDAWNADRPEKPDLSEADLWGVDLQGADLSGADLWGAILCESTIDGARVHPDDLGGPGWILFALTDKEAAVIERARKGKETT